MAKRIDLTRIPVKAGSGYPTPFDLPCAARARQRLGDAAGLTDFGVNLLRLPPGVWSSQRHWHSAEDEFVYILEWPDEQTKTAAWTAFMANEEWAGIKRETAAKHGTLVGAIEDRILRPTDYSPRLNDAPQ